MSQRSACNGSGTAVGFYAVSRHSDRMTRGRLKAILAISFAAAATACASTPDVQGGSSDDAWVLTPPSSANEKLSLAYGVEGTDDVSLILRCDPGSGSIELTAVADTRPVLGHSREEVWSRPSALKSGGEVRSYRGSAADSDYGVLVEWTTGADDPVLASFAKTGDLSIDGKARVAQSTLERTSVARFFAGCGAPPSSQR